MLTQDLPDMSLIKILGNGYKNSTPSKNIKQCYCWSLEIRILIMYGNQKYTKNIMSIYNVCIMNILKYKMFVQKAERDIFKFTKAARNQEYLLWLFKENRTETWIYNLNCLKLECQSDLCQFDKCKEKE